MLYMRSTIFKRVDAYHSFKRINNISSPMVMGDFKEIRKSYLNRYSQSPIVNKYINKDGNLNIL